MNGPSIKESLCSLGFVYHTEVVSPEGIILSSQVDHNLLPQVSIDFIAGLLRGVGSPISTWYVGLFEADYVPTSSTTSADLPPIESTAYTQPARPVWNNTYDGVQLITNFDNPAVYTFSADKTLYGGFLVSNSTKGGNSGTLLSIARFSTPRDVPNGSEFRLRVSISLVSAA